MVRKNTTKKRAILKSVKKSKKAKKTQAAKKTKAAKKNKAAKKKKSLKKSRAAKTSKPKKKSTTSTNSKKSKKTKIDLNPRVHSGPKEFFVILPYTCEPGVSEESTRIFLLLQHLSKIGQVSCLSEAPPHSYDRYRSGLAEQKIELLQNYRPESRAFENRIEQALSSKRWEAVIVVGAESAERWLRPIRFFAPHIPLIAFFPHTETIFKTFADRNPPERAMRRLQLRNIYSLADCLWVQARSDQDHLSQLIAAAEPAVSVLPLRKHSQTGRWVTKVLGIQRVRRAVQSVSVIPFASSLRQANRLGQTVEQVVGENHSIVSVSRLNGQGHVRELNKSLRKARGEIIFIGLHSFLPSQPAIKALIERMRLLPYAGALIPMLGSDVMPSPNGKVPPKAVDLSASWAAAHKGEWEEVDYLEHFCCILLRAKVRETVGYLDVRFNDPVNAFIDYCLRLQQAGYPVFLAKDSLVFCGRSKKAGLNGHGGPRLKVSEDGGIMIDKWCRKNLKFLKELAAP